MNNNKKEPISLKHKILNELSINGIFYQGKIGMITKLKKDNPYNFIVKNSTITMCTDDSQEVEEQLLSMVDIDISIKGLFLKELSKKHNCNIYIYEEGVEYRCNQSIWSTEDIVPYLSNEDQNKLLSLDSQIKTIDKNLKKILFEKKFVLNSMWSCLSTNSIQKQLNINETLDNKEFIRDILLKESKLISDITNNRFQCSLENFIFLDNPMTISTIDLLFFDHLEKNKILDNKNNIFVLPSFISNIFEKSKVLLELKYDFSKIYLLKLLSMNSIISDVFDLEEKSFEKTVVFLILNWEILTSYLVNEEDNYNDLNIGFAKFILSSKEEILCTDYSLSAIEIHETLTKNILEDELEGVVQVIPFEELSNKKIADCKNNKNIIFKKNKKNIDKKN